MIRRTLPAVGGAAVPRGGANIPYGPPTPNFATPSATEGVVSQVPLETLATAPAEFTQPLVSTAPRFPRSNRAIAANKQVTALHHHHDEVTLPRRDDQDAVVDSLDGNQAVAHAAYALSEMAFIFPITPATSMGEICDAKAAAGVKTCHGQPMTVVEMQSELGAAGALHGAATGGALPVTFTSAQGLLLMIPNMYKIAGELLPCVMHVACRCLAVHAQNMYHDHADVMAVRSTGWTMLCSENPQMAHDFAILAHLTAMGSSVPVLHFFDGFRTSHEVNKVETASMDAMAKLLPADKIAEFRQTALSPTRPSMRGVAAAHDVFFQGVEAGNVVRSQVPAVLCDMNEKLAEVTGRRFTFYAYSGAEDAEHVVVIMGSAATTMEMASDHMNLHGGKTGVLKVRLFRPWITEAFLSALPPTVQRVTVLDRCTEPGANGEPLFHEVAASVNGSTKHRHATLLRGRYGIGGKEFTPGMAISVLENSMNSDSKFIFTVGIVDDVGHTSLPLPATEPPLLPKGTVQCVFYGLGSDGTVLANRLATRLINKNTPGFAQAYFQFDAKKSGSLTVSHVRFGPKPLDAPFVVQQADYVGIHRSAFLERYDVLSKLSCGVGAKVVLNCSWTPATLLDKAPRRFLEQVRDAGANLYIVNASKIALGAGCGKNINMIMQTIFFYLNESVLAFEEAKNLLLDGMAASLGGKKDQSVLDANRRAAELAVQYLEKVDVNAILNGDVLEGTATTSTGRRPATIHLRYPQESEAIKRDRYMAKMAPIAKLEGDSIPVSAFKPGGQSPTATSWCEKRDIALQNPVVDMNACIQCGKCSLVCPHAAIRPFLLTSEELRNAPEHIQRHAKPADLAREIVRSGAQHQPKGLSCIIQPSPLDCTGCELCSRICPTGAIKMMESAAVSKEHAELWNYVVAQQDSAKTANITTTTIKGTQLHQPLLEFSGACEGCGETPYVKLLTQVLGERLVIANATGCSSVWASWTPSMPYCVNQDGEGPAWGNSLFEDNAEYGFGISQAHTHRKAATLALVKDILADHQLASRLSEPLKAGLASYVYLCEEVPNDPLLKQGQSSLRKLYQQVLPHLRSEKDKHTKLQLLFDCREFLTKISHWMVGGDGWAYDIGFGGLDHVLHSGKDNVKILVLDTEVYSNTGGQASKATPLGAQVKFAELGKQTPQKDLAQYAMGMRNVYVASVCLEANPEQTLRAMLEAESYPGPALIVAYAPCIAHGYKMSESIDHCKNAVSSGYWPLYRYNPEQLAFGNAPFQVDGSHIKPDLMPFLREEGRFSSVMRMNPDRAKELDSRLQAFVNTRKAVLSQLESAQLAQAEESAHPEEAPTKIAILYGSETGHAQEQAKALQRDLTLRGVVHTSCRPMDSVQSLEDLVAMCSSVRMVFMVVSTCGQGDIPHNALSLWQLLSNPELPTNLLESLSYSVFGLGDSHYAHFCAAAEAFDVRLSELGAQRLLARATGDDQEEGRYVAGWNAWRDRVWPALDLPEHPIQTLQVEPFVVEVHLPRTSSAHLVDPVVELCPTNFACSDVTFAKSYATPENNPSGRDVFGLTVRLPDDVTYETCDSLAVYPRNPEHRVKQLLSKLGVDPKAELVIRPTSTAAGTDTPFPPTVDAFHLFYCLLDIAGPPSATIVEELAAMIHHSAERDALLQRHHSFQAAAADNAFDIVDILTTIAPSCQPTLAQLLRLLPTMKPRLYSIASSPAEVNGPHQLKLTVGALSWQPQPTVPMLGTNMSEPPRHGLCSTFLRTCGSLPTDSSAAAATTVWARVYRSGIPLPPQQDSSRPIIMVGTGTGIAPWQGLISHSFRTNQGTSTGTPIRLYFGTYHKTECAAFEREFDEYINNGMNLQFKSVASHDPPTEDSTSPPLRFVHELLLRDAEDIYNAMVKEQGALYVCGAARGAPASVYNAILNILQRQGGQTIQQSEATVTSWRLQKRYVVEAFQ